MDPAAFLADLEAKPATLLELLAELPVWPVTGSGPPQPGRFPWELILIGGLGSLGATALGLRIRARRRGPQQAGR